ncbi:MAG: hypothetical protein D6784_04685 [Chloroflexi bacterium]|nr:MAG: hypothetical protein D6784_04685 [Chloroflexota bacterium]
MPDSNGRPKDSEIQAASGPPDPELDSLVAPQGYDPDLVDEIVNLETPAQQRRKAIKFLLYSILFLALVFWFCTPANLVVPELSPMPYGIDQRPTPPPNKFLEDAIPRQVGDFRLVDLQKKRVYEDPYIGALTIQATYTDSQGNPATVVVIQAESYINARRYLENYKRLIHEQATVTEWQERLYIEDNFIRWAAPDFAERAYGLAWNNDRYFIAVTSPIRAAQEALAKDFPY